MKTIDINDSISNILTKYSAFYAFSKKSFLEQQNKDYTYKGVGAGLYCPEVFMEDLDKEIQEILESKTKYELENNTPEQIMTYLFDNYECYYTGDYSAVYEELKDYGFSDELIEETWESYCIYNGNGSLIW